MALQKLHTPSKRIIGLSLTLQNYVTVLSPIITCPPQHDCQFQSEGLQGFGVVCGDATELNH